MIQSCEPVLLGYIGEPEPDVSGDSRRLDIFSIRPTYLVRPTQLSDAASNLKNNGHRDGGRLNSSPDCVPRESAIRALLQVALSEASREVSAGRPPADGNMQGNSWILSSNPTSARVYAHSEACTK